MSGKDSGPRDLYMNVMRLNFSSKNDSKEY